MQNLEICDALEQGGRRGTITFPGGERGRAAGIIRIEKAHCWWPGCSDDPKSRHLQFQKVSNSEKGEVVCELVCRWYATRKAWGALLYGLAGEV